MSLMNGFIGMRKSKEASRPFPETKQVLERLKSMEDVTSS